MQGSRKAETTEKNSELEQRDEPKLDMMHETMDDPDSLMLIHVDDGGEDS